MRRTTLVLGMMVILALAAQSGVATALVKQSGEQARVSDMDWRTSSQAAVKVAAILFVSALDQSGVTYWAPAAGVYRFEITGGAYEGTPPESRPDQPELWGWYTKLLLYKNRPVDWMTYPCWQSFPGPGDWDRELGSWILYPTYEAAQLNGQGHYVEIALQAGQYVTMVANDCRDCCFGDNSGGVVVSVRLDAAPPTTICKISGSDRDAFHATFAASDDLTGVDYTEYAVNDDGVWQRGNELIFSLNDVTEIHYRSRDKAGNLEQTRTITVAVSAHGMLDREPFEWGPW